MTSDEEKKARAAVIDEEINAAGHIYQALLHERSELQEAGFYPNSKFWAAPVLIIIGLTPGCSRDDIRKALTRPISEKELTNVLTALRRQGVTENKGTKKRPKWYLRNNS